MGVPGYFKWLITHCGAITVRTAEIDCLYLDMNGILHPCCHGDGGGEEAVSEETMMAKFCGVLDEIISTLHPKKLIYFAFDGPAPVAKMVQQRSRRFCAAHNARVEHKLHQRMAEEWAESGLSTPPMSQPWDSNQITPGTPFMERVRKTIEGYIAQRLVDPAWETFRDVAMLLSDSSDPGEGEHKLIQFIKKQRMVPDYDPATTHCLVGTDADLVQLALSIHDRNIYIYRETIIISIDMIREYFRLTFSPILEAPQVPPHLKDFERLLDDMLLCFCFVGNDFLPHLPQMKIAAYAIGRCLAVYVAVLPAIGEFLVEAGNINLRALDIFVRTLSNVLSAVDEPAIECIKWYERVERGYLKDMETHDYYGSSLDAAFLSALKRRCELYAWKKTAKLFAEDPVCVSAPGWQQRYYAHQWPEMSVTDSMDKVSAQYIRGLQWVMHYYHRECVDWGWYFPYTHGPTLDNIRPARATQEDITFTALGRPLLPMQQLLAVLPRAKVDDLLPKRLIRLMDTKLSSYFPSKFASDCSNAPPRWMEFALLPEIDFEFLREVTGPEIARLPEKVRARNDNKGVRVFVHALHPLAEEACAVGGAMDTGAVRHGVSGRVEDLQTKATLPRLPEGVVRFLFHMPKVRIEPTYLLSPPSAPERSVIQGLIHKKNSRSPLSNDPRLDWTGLPPFAFTTWGVEIRPDGNIVMPNEDKRLLWYPNRQNNNKAGHGRSPVEQNNPKRQKF